MNPKQRRDAANTPWEDEDHVVLTCDRCGDTYRWRRDAPFKFYWCRPCWTAIKELGRVTFPKPRDN